MQPLDVTHSHDYKRIPEWARAEEADREQVLGGKSRSRAYRHVGKLHQSRWGARQAYQAAAWRQRSGGGARQPWTTVVSNTPTISVLGKQCSLQPPPQKLKVTSSSVILLSHVLSVSSVLPSSASVCLIPQSPSLSCLLTLPAAVFLAKTQVPPHSPPHVITFPALYLQTQNPIRVSAP